MNKTVNNSLFIKVTVNICRFLAGLVFLFSGFVKAVDPVGTQIKFEDYSRSFGIDSLFSADTLLIAACVLAGIEFLLGVYMLLGVYRKGTTLFMLIMLSCFTPFTLYLAISSPVSDCGCFGDALVLTNWQTFFKNIFLLSIIVYLFIFKDRIVQFVSNVSQWIVTVTAATLIIFFMSYNVKHLPCLDFRAYNKGVDLRELALERRDIRYVDLSFWDKNGEDLTENLLEYSGYTFLLISSFLEDASNENLDLVDDVYDYCLKYGYRMFGVTASGGRVVDEWKTATGAEYDFIYADEIPLKTIVRSNPGLVLMSDGVFVDKWSHSDIPQEDQISDTLDNILESKGEKKVLLKDIHKIVIVFLSPFLLIILFDWLLVGLKSDKKAEGGIDDKSCITNK